MRFTASIDPICNANGLMLALMASIAVVSAWSLSTLEGHLEKITVERVTKTRLADALYRSAGDLNLHLHAMLLAGDEDRLRQALAGIAAAREAFGQAYEQLQAMPAREGGRKALAAVGAAHDAAAPLNDEVIGLATAGRRDEAVAYLQDQAAAGLDRWRASVDAYLQREASMMDEARTAAVAAAAAARTTLFIVLGFAVVLGVFLGVVFTRSLTGPLARAAAAARELAAGRIDGARLEGGTDEAGEVLRAVQATRETLQTLVSDAIELGRQHDLGNISVRLDETAVQGEFRHLTAVINAVMHEHIQAALHAGHLAAAYARGDLREDFPRVPGGKAVLMEAMDSVKASLLALSQEIGTISQTATRGDFSLRGDEARFEFGFRDMVADLNRLMATTDGSLQSISQLLKAIARGDLGARMEGEYEGVFAEMRDDANATVGHLTTMVSRIQQASRSIDSSAAEISAGNADLARRTEQQAANLEETAATMEELTSTVRQNAEHARQANQLAIGATGVASEGGQLAVRVVETMAGIEESSRKIAEIISLIDGIAFQTNILALNAAVEAARAGEQGRGFAVVASEVRSLAQRSASAAKEIKQLIDDSVEKVANGSELVRQAGDTMHQIVGSVERVTSIMAEISAASQEQSAGIEQVSQTVVQMDEATQQNAALVEEASAAARSMEEQASELVELVSVFRLAGQTPAPAAPVPAAPVRPQADTPPRSRAPRAPAPAPRPAPVLDAAIAGDEDWREF